MTDPLTTYLASLPGRCEHGAHLATQGCKDCAPIAPLSKHADYAKFKALLVRAADSDGVIHQTAVRPLIQDIPHKWRGLLYGQAAREGFIEFAGKEPSTDAAGKNTDKDQKVWRLVGARSAVAA